MILHALRRPGLLAAGGALLALLLPAAAAADVTSRAPIGNPMAGNNGFSTIVRGDALLGSTEMEGPTAIGGNLRFGPGYNVALHTPGSWTAPGDSEPTALLVNGQVDLADSATSGVLRVISGYTKVGDTTGVSIADEDSNGASVNTRVVADGAGYDSTPRIEMTTRQPVDSVGPQPDLMDFDSIFDTYKERARAIAACPNNVDLNGGRITLAPDRTNILHITGDQLNDLSELTFLNKPTKSGPLAIVVDTTATGGTYSWDVPNMAGVSGEDAPYILWDFPDATDITIASGDSIEGTIYAPSAKLTDIDPANIEGDIAVDELVAGPMSSPTDPPVNAGEIHYFPFDAELDCQGPAPSGAVLGAIHLRKTDTANSKLLAGAVFELWRENNGQPGLQTSGDDADLLVRAPCTTTDRGSCEFRFLLPGDYYLRETAAPEEYDLPADPVTGPYAVTAGNADAGVDVVLDNTRSDGGKDK
ncbi:collagen-binding domain-containing protein [Streptomyces boninensis]|uniref:collagen-binding domain-containing protein n=1 Tax=Streptomyces boninensis TaxID=2039455 RepID=UPI003B21094E